MTTQSSSSPPPPPPPPSPPPAPALLLPLLPCSASSPFSPLFPSSSLLLPLPPAPLPHYHYHCHHHPSIHPSILAQGTWALTLPFAAPSPVQHGPRLPSAYQSRFLSLAVQPAENSLKALVNAPILFTCDVQRLEKQGFSSGNDTTFDLRGMPDGPHESIKGRGWHMARCLPYCCWC